MLPRHPFQPVLEAGRSGGLVQFLCTLAEVKGNKGTAWEWEVKGEQLGGHTSAPEICLGLRWTMSAKEPGSSTNLYIPVQKKQNIMRKGDRYYDSTKVSKKSMDLGLLPAEL